MKNTTCLQYCIKGMSDKIFNFAKTQDGKKLIHIFKKWGSTDDERIKELLIATTAISWFKQECNLKACRIIHDQ